MFTHHVPLLTVCDAPPAARASKHVQKLRGNGCYWQKWINFNGMNLLMELINGN
jgi:hypothetical protein